MPGKTMSSKNVTLCALPKRAIQFNIWVNPTGNPFENYAPASPSKPIFPAEISASHRAGAAVPRVRLRAAGHQIVRRG
jgi:hypothetical protein